MGSSKTENTPAADDTVVITGVSCRFAGARNPAWFWRNIIEQRSSLTPLSADAAVPLGGKHLFDTVYPAAAGQLGDLYSCISADQEFPRQINSGENQDLFFATQLALDAVEDAGERPHSDRPVNGGVYLGYSPPFNSSTVNWLDHTLFIDQTTGIIRRFFPNAPSEALDEVKRKLSESLPVPNPESFLTCTGHRVALWISKRLGYTGPAAVIDCGMLSSSMCVKNAIDDLTNHRVDIAIAGALEPPLTRAYLQGIAGVVEFSPSGRLYPFSRESNGTLPGEGGAVFVLKRRADAIASHDRIYAAVKAVGICPTEPYAVANMCRGVCESSQMKTESLRLIEACGSGIPESDAGEAAAISMLAGAHAPGKPLVGVGSVKGNIGHTLQAAGAAGLLKTALALYHRVLPPQIPVPAPLEVFSSVASGAYLLTEPLPWITGDVSSPRRAAVLSSGLSGRTSVVILEEEQEERG